MCKPTKHLWIFQVKKGEQRKTERKSEAPVDAGRFISGLRGCPDQDNRFRGNYGIISMFDRISSTVSVLQRKIGNPPEVVVLAENDTSLRALVCAEFGYRTDQKWGYTINGSASIYVKDVNSTLEDDCKILKEAHILSPNARWFIIGGSPRQDLTFAGTYRGVLGLVGKNSRFFFSLLRAIRAMQEIAGIERVRYLIENAGSMVELHFHAFCELQGLSRQPKDQYLWDPADHGYPITRKRNVFRNHQDKQDIINKPLVEFDNGGPLLSREQKAIALAPLLRTREFLPFDIVDAVPTKCINLGL